MTSAMLEPEGERDSMLLVRINGSLSSFFPSAEEACLLLDQIKREKGVWWMPWQ
jgi:hypothetical protein